MLNYMTNKSYLFRDKVILLLDNKFCDAVL